MTRIWPILQDYVPLTFSLSLFALGSNYTDAQIDGIVAKVRVRATLCFVIVLVVPERSGLPTRWPLG